MSILSRMGVPAFKAGGQPSIDFGAYRLELTGLVAQPLSLTWPEILALPYSVVNARLTSVSGWSVRADWGGVLWRDFLSSAPPLPKATHVTFVSVGGGYATTTPLSDMDTPRVILAYNVADEPLEPEYGGPLRLVIPNLWGYKSCKWLGKIELTDQLRGGYWEDRGYPREAYITVGETLDVNSGTRREHSAGEILGF
ncbi:MAG TPA: molybdopterin-dependent oxidoreductase [Syntrophobacteria bacterium]|nr:molybdopterin-dependent oxidoreductase [Syntrophobacteria bacterium]